MTLDLDQPDVEFGGIYSVFLPDRHPAAGVHAFIDFIATRLLALIWHSNVVMEIVPKLAGREQINAGKALFDARNALADTLAQIDSSMNGAGRPQGSRRSGNSLIGSWNSLLFPRNSLLR